MAPPPRVLTWVKAAIITHAIVMVFSLPAVAWMLYVNLGEPDDEMASTWILAALALLVLGTVAITLYILVAYGSLGLVRRMILRRAKTPKTASS